MNIRDLECTVALAEHRPTSDERQTPVVSQPTLSGQIHKLKR